MASTASCYCLVKKVSGSFFGKQSLLKPAGAFTAYPSGSGAVSNNGFFLQQMLVASQLSTLKTWQTLFLASCEDSDEAIHKITSIQTPLDGGQERTQINEVSFYPELNGESTMVTPLCVTPLPSLTFSACIINTTFNSSYFNIIINLRIESSFNSMTLS